MNDWIEVGPRSDFLPGEYKVVWECPRHGARFDLRTGAVTHPPAYIPIASFPVREEDGTIWTRDDR